MRFRWDGLRMVGRRVLVAALLSATLAAAHASAAANPELVVATYNLRYAGDSPPNSWPERRPAIKALLDAYRPDVIGTQEGLFHQLKDLAADQPDYDWIGLGRDGGSRGEFMAVFYRRDRLEPLEFDHFWLSDTPEVIASSSWGNAVRRMVTWVRFRDRITGREFYFWNTHLDHEVQAAREKAAELIRQRIGQLPADVPLLLVGDFNAVSGANRAYDILARESGLSDTWHAARERRNEDANSFTGFEPLKHDGQRIDWILARGVREVRVTEAVTLRPDAGRATTYPSLPGSPCGRNRAASTTGHNAARTTVRNHTCCRMASAIGGEWR
jgi:endonuclease/exonuclease/phosphatase family metal-dependent hydrolase